MTLASPLKTVIGRNGSIIRRHVGAGGRYETVRANGADIFISAWVTYAGETAGDPDVDLCAKGETPNGIIVGPAFAATDLDKDSDDCFADNTWLRMYIPLPGEEVYCTAKTNSDITAGGRIVIDGGFVDDLAYADGTENTDTMQSTIGNAMTAATAAATTEKVVLIRIGAVI